MTAPDGLVERLRDVLGFIDPRGSRVPMYRNPDGPEAADCIEALTAEVEEAHETIVAFCGPWAVTYAREFGLPEGHLHPTHFDILAKAGARMDDFTRSRPVGEGET